MLCLLESKVQSWSSLGQGWVRKGLLKRMGPKLSSFSSKKNLVLDMRQRMEKKASVMLRSRNDWKMLL